MYENYIYHADVGAVDEHRASFRNCKRFGGVVFMAFSGRDDVCLELVQ